MLLAFLNRKNIEQFVMFMDVVNWKSIFARAWARSHIGQDAYEGGYFPTSRAIVVILLRVTWSNASILGSTSCFMLN
jgi:hypothetical protein